MGTDGIFLKTGDPNNSFSLEGKHGVGHRAQSLFTLNIVENVDQLVRENHLHLLEIKGLSGSSWASGAGDAPG